MDEYDPATCITAKEFRDKGIRVPDYVPDCGWIRASSVKHKVVSCHRGLDSEIAIDLDVEFLDPFRWVTFTIRRDK